MHPEHPDADLLPLLKQKMRKRDYSLWQHDGKKNKMCKLKDYEGDKTISREQREKK